MIEHNHAESQRAGYSTDEAVALCLACRESHGHGVVLDGGCPECVAAAALFGIDLTRRDWSDRA